MLTLHPLTIYSRSTDTLYILLNNGVFKLRKLEEHWGILEHGDEILGYCIRDTKKFLFKLGLQAKGAIRVNNLLQLLSKESPAELEDLIKYSVLNLCKDRDLKLRLN